MQLHGKRLAFLARHEKSAACAWGFCSFMEMNPEDFHAVIMEKDKEPKEKFEQKRDAFYKEVRSASFDVIVIATKLNGNSITLDLVPFLLGLKHAGVASTPIILTHLTALTDDEQQALAKTGLSISWVEHDNLGFYKHWESKKDAAAARTGMKQLGAQIMSVV